MDGQTLKNLLVPLSYGIAFFVCICIYHKDRKNRKHWKNVYDKSGDDHNSLWCICTLVSCIVCCIAGVVAYSPFTCLYGIPLLSSLLAVCKIFLTFYQIARLQYCCTLMANKQKHLIEFGYPQWLFLILYFIGIILFLFYTITTWFVFDIYYAQNSKNCIYHSTNLISYWSSIYLFYITWDISILVLYVYKIHKLKRYVGISNNDKIKKLDQNEYKIVS